MERHLEQGRGLCWAERDAIAADLLPGRHKHVTFTLCGVGCQHVGERELGAGELEEGILGFGPARRCFDQLGFRSRVDCDPFTVEGIADPNAPKDRRWKIKVPRQEIGRPIVPLGSRPALPAITRFIAPLPRMPSVGFWDPELSGAAYILTGSAREAHLPSPIEAGLVGVQSSPAAAQDWRLNRVADAK